MARITSKYQVTIPKALADRHELEPGDEIEWSSTGDSIRVRPARPASTRHQSLTERLKRFDEATARQKRRRKHVRPANGERGWTREDLYRRGRAR